MSSEKQDKAVRARQRSRTATLMRKSSLTVLTGALLRIFFVFALIAMAIAVHWFDKGGLQDSYDGDVSFLDVVYFTFISITTTGYGDIVPVTERARVFDALIVTPIRIFVVLIFIGSAYNFVLKRTWDNWRMKILQNNLQNHVIVAGYGVSGSEAVKELLARGQDPKTIVVVDTGTEAINAAKDLGCNVICADATRDKTLKELRIERASSVIVSAGTDDTSILITLTVRHLAPRVPISVVVRASDNELLAKQAGADNVINPVSFAGLLLAGSCHGEHIADYIADLASVTGRVALAERMIREDETGKPMTALDSGVGVRLYRDGKPYGFWQQEAQSMQIGDSVVEIVPGAGAETDKDGK